MLHCLSKIIPESMTFGFTSLHWDEFTGFDTRIIFFDSTAHIPAFPTLCCIAVSLVLCFQLRSTSLFREMFQAVYWGLWVFKGIITDESMKVKFCYWWWASDTCIQASHRQLVSWGCRYCASAVRFHTQPLDGKLFRYMEGISCDTNWHSNAL